jgi:hypothetical protein
VTLDECKKCPSHTLFRNGAVHCTYDKNMISMATVMNPKLKQYVILNCPKERKKDK